MTAIADRLYAMLLEGLVFLGANPVECSAVEMLQTFSLILVALLGMAIVMHRCGSLWLERRAQPLDDARATMILNRCVIRSGLGYRPRLLAPPPGSPPVFAAGGRRGVVYLHPELVERLDDRELEAALLHELAHLRERDQLVASWLHVLVFFSFAVLVQAWIIAFFFQRAPLHFGSFRAELLMSVLFVCYLLIRALFRGPLGYLREIDCDAAAIRWGARPADLASALVETARMKLERRKRILFLPLTTALVSPPGDIEARVRRALYSGPRPFRARLFLRRVMLAGLFSLLLFVASFHIRSAESPNPPSGWAQIVVP